MSTHHPIQPLVKDSDGILRFKENAIVEHLYQVAKKHGCGMNELGAMPFSNEDRQQFAQLVGYSLCGYSELTSYVTDDAYGAAVEVSKGKSPDKARIKHLEGELKAIRKALRAPMARLFGIHPDDLTRND